MTTRIKLASTVMVTLLLIGCGQRGPLYLPEPAPQNQPPESPSTETIDEQGG